MSPKVPNMSKYDTTHLGDLYKIMHKNHPCRIFPFFQIKELLLNISLIYHTSV